MNDKYKLVFACLENIKYSFECNLIYYLIAIFNKDKNYTFENISTLDKTIFEKYNITSMPELIIFKNDDEIKRFKQFNINEIWEILK